jgi:xanthine dehydrogenase accessory factor
MNFGLGFVPVRGVHSDPKAGDWLRPLSGDWPSAVCAELEIAPSVVRVACVRGSSPREPGTCMLVSAAGTVGTVGGGHLESQAIQFAREWLRRHDEVRAHTQRLVLGTQLGQCCGGVVELWIERFARRDLPFLRSAAQAARSSEPALMATVMSSAGLTRRVIQAAAPAFLPPHLRPIAEALLASEATERARYVMEPDLSFPKASTKRMPAGPLPPERPPSTRSANSVTPDASPAPGSPSAGSATLERISSVAAAGTKNVLLERLNPASAELWLYGAGHVGQALVRALSELPLRITWIDSRAELLPERLPPNIRTVRSSEPAQEAQAAPLSAWHLVMTHDHALDYEICRSLLRRNEMAWVGLIGSASKGAKFRLRLQRDGVPPAAIDRLVCPIGVEGVEGKAPSVIAISVAAQLLQAMSARQSVHRQAEVTFPGERPILQRAPALPERRRAERLPYSSERAAPADRAAHLARPPERTSFALERTLGDCAAENCDSCGTQRRASV